MTTTLVVHPDSSFSYYGYYLHGFEQALGPLRIRFSRNDLPALLSQRDGIAVLLADGCRIFIAADDHTTINEVALEWCDVYGMVNLDRSASPAADSRKVVPIGPGFGIRWATMLMRLATC